MNPEELRRMAESVQRQRDVAKRQAEATAAQRCQADSERLQRERELAAERMTEKILGRVDQLAQEAAAKGENRALVYSGTHLSETPLEYFKDAFLFIGEGKWVKRTPEETAREISRWDLTCYPVFSYLRKKGFGVYFEAQPYCRGGYAAAGISHSSRTGTFELWMTW
jgi:hypothetical protein